MNIHWSIKIIGGITILSLLIYLFNIIESFELFLTIVCLPLFFLHVIGVISEGTYEAWASGQWIQDLKQRLEQARAKLGSSNEEPLPAEE